MNAPLTLSGPLPRENGAILGKIAADRRRGVLDFDSAPIAARGSFWGFSRDDSTRDRDARGFLGLRDPGVDHRGTSFRCPLGIGLDSVIMGAAEGEKAWIVALWITPSLDLCGIIGAEQSAMCGRLANWSRRAWGRRPGGGGECFRFNATLGEIWPPTPASNSPGPGARSSLSNCGMALVGRAPRRTHLFLFQVSISGRPMGGATPAAMAYNE